MSAAAFDVFAPVRPPSPRTRGQHLDPILREHLISRAQLLREGNVSNADIAAALDVSVATIISWIGKQPSSARKPRTSTPRPRAMRPFASDLGLDAAFDYHAALDHLQVIDAPQGRAAETLLHDTADILAAIHDAIGATATLHPAGVHVRYLESDDMPWYDEPEPPLPPVPSDYWFARYATYVRNARFDAVNEWERLTGPRSR